MKTVEITKTPLDIKYSLGRWWHDVRGKEGFLREYKGG
jgi:hypothetical protein